jgi:hypothetical protein
MACNRLAGLSQNPLLSHLHAHGAIGKRNAIPRDILAASMRLPLRDVQALAEAARLDGEFVCFSKSAKRGGMYLAETDAERDELLDRLRRECLSRLKQRRSLRLALRNRWQRDLFVART